MSDQPSSPAIRDSLCPIRSTRLSPVPRSRIMLPVDARQDRERLRPGRSALRFSFGRRTTEAHIDHAIAAVRRAHAALWPLSPGQPLPLEDWPAHGGELLVGEGGALRLGTWVRFLAHGENGLIRDARVQVYGYPHTIAASSHVRQQLIGRQLHALVPGTPEQWRLAVNAPVEKLGRMLIIEDALRALRPAPRPSS